MSRGQLDRVYARFEERFRGSRDEILARLAVYRPLLALIREKRPAPTAIDCGCGRGEWLELLHDDGWNALGVDTNTDMLSITSSHGLTAVRADAVAYLTTRPSESVDMISAFHFVEHLPTETLLTFIAEAMRVLAKDGVILLETPNPENLLVGTCNFYLDPTHDRPLPPQLLQFFVNDAGASVAEIIRLNGERRTAAPEGSIEAAVRPLFTRGLDYAILGTKSSDPDFGNAISMLGRALGEVPPVDLSSVAAADTALAARYREVASGLEVSKSEADSQDRRLTHVETTLNDAGSVIASRVDDGFAAMRDAQRSAEERMTQAIASVSSRLVKMESDYSLRGELEDARARLTSVIHQAATRETELQAQIASLRHELQQSLQQFAAQRAQESAIARQLSLMYESTSWRITRPMRLLVDIARKSRRAGAPAIKETRGLLPEKSTDKPRSSLMIDPHPEAIAAWSALFENDSRSRKS